MQDPDCPHYLKKGWCAFGATCKFHHSDETAGSMAGMSPAGGGGGYFLANFGGMVPPPGGSVLANFYCVGSRAL